VCVYLFCLIPCVHVIVTRKKTPVYQLIFVYIVSYDEHFIQVLYSPTDNTGRPETRFIHVVKYLRVTSCTSLQLFYLRQLARVNTEDNNLNKFCSPYCRFTLMVGTQMIIS